MYGFGNVRRFYSCAAFKVCNGARHFNNAVMRTGAEPKRGKVFAKHGFGLRLQFAVFIKLLFVHLRIAVHAAAFKTFALHAARFYNAAAYNGRTFSFGFVF